ncbi:hypothetical protein DOTSEDRAFT_31245 [Dothistroma septosporum NZE10]|uniref:Uncharacterized protein n=1 Tax=Dothistroma septosporum (strain NZE10 / CBS 128990) TaxID=675120 RepID=N1Q302_DOTSN|nr:hypothetical protein DOTSEDRAFT_31245 [Dothistroma septosporum NZE10]
MAKNMWKQHPTSCDREKSILSAYWSECSAESVVLLDPSVRTRAPLLQAGGTCIALPTSTFPSHYLVDGRSVTHENLKSAMIACTTRLLHELWKLKLTSRSGKQRVHLRAIEFAEDRPSSKPFLQGTVSQQTLGQVEAGMCAWTLSERSSSTSLSALSSQDRSGRTSRGSSDAPLYIFAVASGEHDGDGDAEVPRRVPSCCGQPCVDVVRREYGHGAP